jgi:Contractile injection system tube protein
VDVLSALEKAMLIVVDGVGVPMMLRFKYNPEQYTVEKSAKWNRPEAPGAESTPDADYTSTNPTSVSMEIFFDAFEELQGDVSKDVETLFTWTKPTPISRTSGEAQPPLLMFQWGSSSNLSGFRGFLSSVSARYTLFRVDGTPIRATCNIRLEEVPQETARQNPTSGTRPGMRVHVLTEGETLHSVAWAEYKQARYWRGLAAFNDIDDPMRVEPGATLLLPSPRDVARLS